MDGTARVTESGAEGRGILGGHAERAAEIDANEEKGEVPDGGGFSTGLVRKSQNRSRFGGRRRESSSELGLPRFSLAMAAFGMILISLLTFRFTACLEASVLHRLTPRGRLGGVPARRLEGKTNEAFAADEPATDLEDCPRIFTEILGDKHPGAVVVPVTPRAAAAAGGPESDLPVHRRVFRWLQQLPVKAKLYGVVVLLLSLASLVCAIVAEDPDGPLAISGVVLSQVAFAMSIVAVGVNVRMFLEARRSLRSALQEPE